MDKSTPSITWWQHLLFLCLHRSTLVLFIFKRGHNSSSLSARWKCRSEPLIHVLFPHKMQFLLHATLNAIANSFFFFLLQVPGLPRLVMSKPGILPPSPVLSNAGRWIWQDTCTSDSVQSCCSSTLQRDSLIAPVSTYQLLSGVEIWNMGRLACNQVSGEVQKQLREKNPINKLETSIVYNILEDKKEI